jgi:predicted nucleic acid-binding protein
MRDVFRIPGFLRKLERLWCQHPDLRFWQLVVMIEQQAGGDLFYTEDDQLAIAIDRMTRKDS